MRSSPGPVEEAFTMLGVAVLFTAACALALVLYAGTAIGTRCANGVRWLCFRD